MDNRLNKIMGIIIFIIAALGLILGILITMPVKYIQNNIYCNNNNKCYRYEKNDLNLYQQGEQEEVGEYPLEGLEKSCKLTRFINKCNLNIVRWNKNYLIINSNNNIDIYYRYDTRKIIGHNGKAPAKVQKELAGKLYTNGKIELYFINDKHVVISGEDQNQRIKELSTKDYAYGYYNYSFEGFGYDDYFKFSYNANKKEIPGYKKKTLKEAKYIDTKFYNEKGELNDKYKEPLTGMYKHGDSELIVINGKYLKTTRYDVEKGIFNVTNVNDKYITYNIYYLYDKEKNAICLSENYCLQAVDKSELTIISPDYYDENLNVIDPNININGAYSCEKKESDETVTSEMYIDGDQVKRIDYARENYTRNKQYQFKMKLYTRSANKLNYVSENGSVNMTYNINDNTMYGTYHNNGDNRIFKKIDKKDLKYLKV